MDYTVHGILQARILGWVALRDLPNPGIKPRSSALQADSLLAEPQGKPKNTGVGSLSLSQEIFPTQESNQGLLRCRWILYQLTYQGIPCWLGAPSSSTSHPPQHLQESLPQPNHCLSMKKYILFDQVLRSWLFHFISTVLQERSPATAQQGVLNLCHFDTPDLSFFLLGQ